ncbi:unnamed protein product [Oikopleura dioica]|uniref:Uncharacterized protein n=1 Tax=Oikopleura dioica TaxID=34765 RepID=E4XEW8_OIKDI|nr:unnamed protein product [Oikopleura dioica]
MKVFEGNGSLAERLDNMADAFRNLPGAEPERMDDNPVDPIPIVRGPVEPNAFDPGFLGVRPDVVNEREGTHAQQAQMLKAMADSRDEKTHKRLAQGVRPGEFFELFASLGWVKKTRTNAICAAFLESLKSWCDHMRDVDMGMNALPESKQHMPLSMPLTVFLNWAQKAIWKLCLDAPNQLAGFVVHVNFNYTPGFTKQTGTRVVLEGLESIAEVRRLINERSSENLNESIVSAELARLENFKREIGFAHKLTEYPADGSDADIIAWAIKANEEIVKGAKKMTDFTNMVASTDKWTLDGTYKYLTSCSMLKELQGVARFDNLSSNTIVTVSDTGTLRAFVYNDGTVSRTNKLPAYCRSWRLVTGGRSNINYGSAGGFFPEGGYRREEREGDHREPPAKRRWGRGGGSYRGNSNRGAYRGRGRGGHH